MELTAITRQVSASINDCELSFHARQQIDVAKAITQHKAYQECLAELGARIVRISVVVENILRSQLAQSEREARDINRAGQMELIVANPVLGLAEYGG